MGKKKKMNSGDCATGFQGKDVFVSGLSKFELTCIHLMSASVTANDYSNPDWMTAEIAEKHAKSAVMLANALIKEINNSQDSE